MTRPRPVLLREFDDRSPAPEETETATFALGCFWGPDAEFAAVDGVVRTRVGYAGGTEPDPTYHSLSDHTETIQVDYDPEGCSYRDLLEIVFRSHNPRTTMEKVQYQNIVFTDSEAQRETLGAFLEERGLNPDSLGTRFEALERFYPAEAYHQKYNLKSKRWVTNAFQEAGYSPEDVRESPAAAVLNAHVSGHDIEAPRLLDDNPSRT